MGITVSKRRHAGERSERLSAGSVGSARGSGNAVDGRFEVLFSQRCLSPQRKTSSGEVSAMLDDLGYATSLGTSVERRGDSKAFPSLVEGLRSVAPPDLSRSLAELSY